MTDITIYGLHNVESIISFIANHIIVYYGKYKKHYTYMFDGFFKIDGCIGETVYDNIDLQLIKDKLAKLRIIDLKYIVNYFL